MPPNYEAIIKHEFGHAVGFEHEHQNPQGGCDDEFRWDDDPGYVKTIDSSKQVIPDDHGRRPGIYSVLKGPPNSWKESEINLNLRQLPDSSAFGTSKFDNDSIMKYAFPDWMYKKGTSSPCYSKPNENLSPLDELGMARLYPRQLRDITEVLKQEKAAAQTLQNAPGLPAETRFELAERMKSLLSVH